MHFSIFYDLVGSTLQNFSSGGTFSKKLLNKDFWKNVWKIYIEFAQKF